MLILHGVMEALRSTCFVGCLPLVAVYVGANFCTDYISDADSHVYPGYTRVDSEFLEHEVFTRSIPV